MQSLVHYNHHTSAGLGCGRFHTLHEFYQRIGSCVVVVVLRAVDTRRRLHPYNHDTLWRLGGAGTRSVLLEIAVLRHDLIYDTDAVERPLDL